MNNNHVIIIGAGAAGLAAAKQLSKAGILVTILEARNRIGGRIHTLREKKFTKPVELGAEFIHGDLPTTLKLLKEYNISYSPAKGQIWQVRKGTLEKDKDFIEDHHRQLEKRLKALKKDTSIKHFLNRYFPEKEYSSLRESVKGFVEGYESADIDNFSAMTFREEWLGAEDWKNYRVDGGYGKLMQSLLNESKKNGTEVHLSAIVKEVRWKNNFVQVICEGGKRFIADKVVVAVPLGVLQKNSIRFSPALPEKIKAAKQLGYGNVIKILFQFKRKFWENKKTQERLDENLNKLFFLFSKERIPTWWTQYPTTSPLLTGWLSGPKAKERASRTDKEIFEEALESLANIFEEPKNIFKKKLASWKVVNWCKDEFTQGSYVYATVGAKKHIQKIGKPVKDTLFFAGELFSKGGGTVEDALTSGLNIAEKFLSKMDLKQ